MVLESIRRGQPGYADGGLVAPIPFVPARPVQSSDPEVKRLLRELIDLAREAESNDKTRHTGQLRQLATQTEIMERQENIGMPRERKENAVVV
jgi:predicted acylesterase/phospholipase RssA